MYLAIDVGGTKTLVGVYSESGELLSKTKIETNHDYDAFIESIKNALPDTKYDIKKCIVGIPGLVNREKGIVYALGNLPWKDKVIAADLSSALGGVKVLLENDARLAGLAEASALNSPAKSVLYLTISTGIGGALIVDKKIVKELQDTEMGHMPLIHDGRLLPWEKFASGQSVVEDYGKKAAEINDPVIWQEIGEKIAYGVGALCAVLQPEVIVFGGGVGQFAERFTPAVKKYLEENLHPVVVQPSVLAGPACGEDNVLRGCYELATQS